MAFHVSAPLQELFFFNCMVLVTSPAEKHEPDLC